MTDHSDDELGSRLRLWADSVPPVSAADARRRDTRAPDATAGRQPSRIAGGRSLGWLAAAAIMVVIAGTLWTVRGHDAEQGVVAGGPTDPPESSPIDRSSTTLSPPLYPRLTTCGTSVPADRGGPAPADQAPADEGWLAAPAAQAALAELQAQTSADPSVATVVPDLSAHVVRVIVDPGQRVSDATVAAVAIAAASVPTAINAGCVSGAALRSTQSAIADYAGREAAALTGGLGWQIDYLSGTVVVLGNEHDTALVVAGAGVDESLITVRFTAITDAPGTLSGG